MKLGEVSILVNDNTDINHDNILQIAKNVKRLNIVTRNISKFKKVEEYLYDELGIMIKISNNTKKDLLNSDIIINMDFPEELINNYAIPRKCIIINLNEKIDIYSKRFNGIIINNYKIRIPKQYALKDFRNEAMYESYIFQKNIEQAKKQIKDDKITIKKLIGKNGVISKEEFKCW